MDPLSVAASAITVAALATQVGSTILKIRARNDFQGRLQAIKNELTDLGGVLRYIGAMLEQRKQNKIADDALKVIQTLISRIDSKLRELNRLLVRLQGPPSSPRKPIIVAAIWLKEKANIQLIQEDLRSMKVNLNHEILLVPANQLLTVDRLDSVRIRLELRRISVCADVAEEARTNFQKQNSDTLSEQYEAITQTLFDHHNHFDRRMDQLEDKWVKQLDLAQVYQTHAFVKSVGSVGSTPRQPPESMMIGLKDPEAQKMSLATRNLQQFRFPGVRVQALQYKGPICKSWCPCSCHSQGKVKTPKILDQVVGQLFVRYTGLPYVSNPCDKRYCERRQAPFVAMEYYFPSWWMTHIVKMTLACQPMAGPQINLTTLRRVPDTAQCFLLAMKGDIDGVRSLMIANQASTKDVAATTGYTMLTWAVIKRQVKMAEFLLSSGSDPHHDPSGIQPTPSDLAWDVFLRGVIPKNHELAIRSLLHHSDFVDEQNFPSIHKIVLGLSMKSLDEELYNNPRSPFEVDAQGRTALSWAACRGDAISCLKLITKGADPNALDKHLKSPLYLAVNSEHPTQNNCVRVLLEAGAETDPVLHNSGVVRSTPLLCAANEADDILVLKSLLDFGANIEATNRVGATPLLIVARSKPVTYTALLLAYGANVRARDKAGRSVLATAIMHNNHEVLRYLLDRWFRYTACPRLRNLDVLHVAAEYGDLETLEILVMAGHWGLRSDSRDQRGFTAEELMYGKADDHPKLARAFASLLRAVHGTPTSIEKDRMMEAGLFRKQRYGARGTFGPSFTEESRTWDSDDGEDEADHFKDAQEVL